MCGRWFLLLVAAPAFGLTLESLVTKATFECIGVRVTYNHGLAIRERLPFRSGGDPEKTALHIQARGVMPQKV